MKFNLETSARFHFPERAARLERELGMKFEKASESAIFTMMAVGGGRQPLERMYGPVNQASVEIRNLDELLAFGRKWNEIILIPPDKDEPGREWTLEIYDDYRE